MKLRAKPVIPSRPDFFRRQGIVHLWQAAVAAVLGLAGPDLGRIWAAGDAGPSSGSPSYATAAEVQGYDYIVDDNDFTLSSDGRQMEIWFPEGQTLWDISSWRGKDMRSDEYYWGSMVEPAAGGKYLVGNVYYHGKPWIGLRERGRVEGEMIYQIPKDLGGEVLSFSPDGQGVYVQIYQRLQRWRSQPKDDFPPTEDLNAHLMVSSNYATGPEWMRIPKAYPEAYAERSRNYVIYLDLKTKQTRRIFTGNDILDVEISPDGRTMLALQGKSPTWDHNLKGWRSGDVYLISLPAVAEMPPIDLSEAKENERNAGWFDHEQKRMDPVLRDIGLGGNDWTRLSWAPDSSKFAWAEMGRNHTGDIRIYDVATRRTTSPTSQVDLTKLAPRVPEPLQWQLGSPSLRFGYYRIPPHWLPDSRAVLATARGYLWLLPADGGAAENLSLQSGPAGIVEVVAAATAVSLAYQPAPDEVLVKTTDAGTLQDGIARFNLGTRRLVPVLENAGCITHPQVSASDGILYYAAITADHPRQIFARPLAESASDASRQLTDCQKELKERRLPEKLLISFVTKRGRKGWGRLCLPAGGDPTKKWPLVMTREITSPSWAPPDTMPGRYDPYYAYEHWSSLDVWRMEGPQSYNQETQTFNRAGYAVLFFDLPLSGPGEYDDLRESVVEGYDAATEAVVATERVDPEKIALWAKPGSANGLFALMALSQRNSYAAAAMFGAYGLTESQALSPGEYWANEMRFGEGRMASALVEAPDRYLGASPLPLMGELKTPVLALQGIVESIYDVPTLRVHEIFGAIQPTGVKSVAVIYNKMYSPEDDAYRRIILWFDEHLRGGPAAAARASLPPPAIN